jgi:hypothetical protein
MSVRTLVGTNGAMENMGIYRVLHLDDLVFYNLLSWSLDSSQACSSSFPCVSFSESKMNRIFFVAVTYAIRSGNHSDNLSAGESPSIQPLKSQ